MVIPLIYQQRIQPARPGSQRGHARHGSPAAPLSPCPSGQGIAAQRAKPERAWLDGRCPCGWRMRAACCVAALATHPPAPIKPEADNLSPQPSRHGATRAAHGQPAPSCGLYAPPIGRADTRHAGQSRPRAHTAAAAQAGRARPAWRRGTPALHRKVDASGGGETPPRLPACVAALAPPPAPLAPVMRGRCEATPATAGHPAPLSPGASAPGIAPQGGRPERAWRRGRNSRLGGPCCVPGYGRAGLIARLRRQGAPIRPCRGRPSPPKGKQERDGLRNAGGDGLRSMRTPARPAGSVPAGARPCPPRPPAPRREAAAQGGRPERAWRRRGGGAAASQASKTKGRCPSRRGTQSAGAAGPPGPHGRSRPRVPRSPAGASISCRSATPALRQGVRKARVARFPTRFCRPAVSHCTPLRNESMTLPCQPRATWKSRI
jgi:hypothetical protein